MPRHVDIEELPAVDPQILAKLAAVTTPAHFTAALALIRNTGRHATHTTRRYAVRARQDAQRANLHLPPWYALRIAHRNGTLQLPIRDDDHTPL